MIQNLQITLMSRDCTIFRNYFSRIKASKHQKDVLKLLRRI